MAAREWGFLCPVDGGLLLSLKGTDRLHCTNNIHNGRPKTHPEGYSPPTPAFYDRANLQEGYATVAKDTPSGAGLTEKQIKQMQGAAKADPASDKAAEDAVNGAAKPVRVRAAKEPKACECGCGGQTKGGRYLPGHDAKHHSRIAKEREAEALAKA